MTSGGMRSLPPIRMLRIYLEEVYLDDSFLMIGGDSITMASMIVQTGELIGITIPVHVAIENQTIRELACAIDMQCSELVAVA